MCVRGAGGRVGAAQCVCVRAHFFKSLDIVEVAGTRLVSTFKDSLNFNEVYVNLLGNANQFALA